MRVLRIFRLMLQTLWQIAIARTCGQLDEALYGFIRSWPETDSAEEGFMMWVIRLLRRIRWLLVYQWRSLSLRRWPYETCWMCGQAVRIRWSVQDRYWRQVVGVPDEGGGSLCLSCFLEYAEWLHIDVPVEAFTYEIFRPEPELNEAGRRNRCLILNQGHRYQKTLCQ
jgi:hypothetical protein